MPQTRGTTTRGTTTRGTTTRGTTTQKTQRRESQRETRHEQLLRRQAERRRQVALERRNQRIKKIGLWGGGFLGVVLVIFLIARAITSGGGSTTVGNISGVATYKVVAGHKNGSITYAQVPPVGGDHNPSVLNCGIYNAQVPNENAVHALEHGAVWITYQPNLASASVNQLVNLVKGQDHGLLSPYPGLPAPVVASAWGVQLKVQSATDARLKQFLTKYEQGPQTPELGAGCSGGVGAPTA
ncbi:MAG: DUF3105 domain-containing protein [Ktedonobacterales bacterium]|nr:DUF3105 domain-containing protein [Ktedonobacterales bacterium]